MATIHRFVLTSAILALAVLSGVSQAQERHGHGGPGRPGPVPGYRSPHWQFDNRYHHDHYYPSRGYVAAALPGGSISIGFHGGNYFYQGGVWFRPQGPRYVVVAPPFGIVVPLLPPAYTTLYIGGAPYYYANGAYYATAPGGYAVVEPPPGADVAQPAPVPPPPKPEPDPILYPRNGQSPAQTEADRQECNRWATTQPAAMADASVFQRAVAACMDGRGYTVR